MITVIYRIAKQRWDRRRGKAALLTSSTAGPEISQAIASGKAPTVRRRNNENEILLELQAIKADRLLIHAAFEQAARLGYVPADALIGRLYANHGRELIEDRRRLDALERELLTHLRRLNALFPCALPPEPTPPRPRRFGRIGSDTGSRSGSDVRH